MAENKKYESGTLGWLREQQKIKAEKDGFDNVDDWLKWRSDPFNILEHKYGKEFTDWARQNKGKVPNKWLNAGCKTITEYNNKKARDAGFKNYNEREQEWRHETGRQLPKEFNEDCPSHFGDFTENLMIRTFEDPIKMPYGNPGFDWKCNNGDKIDNKGACLQYIECRSPIWKFGIMWNDIADWFILSAWDNRESKKPLYVWAFHKNDMVRKGKGSCAPKVEFWRRETFSITNTPEGLKGFEKYEVTNRLEKLKELCNR